MPADPFVLDASVLAAAALPNEPHHADARALMQRLMVEQASLSLPAVALAEVAAAIARGAGAKCGPTGPIYPTGPRPV
jgi:predicted nucleic acid-binding protein